MSKNQAVFRIGRLNTRGLSKYTVKTEDREASIERQARWAACCELLKMEYVPVLETGFVLESGQEREVKYPGFTEEAKEYFIFLVVQAVSKSVNDEDLISLLMKFHNQYGPIFTRPWISITDIRLRLLQYFLFSCVYRSVTNKYPNTEWAFSILEKMIYHPFLDAKERHPDYSGTFEIIDIEYDEEAKNNRYIMIPSHNKNIFRIPSNGPLDTSQKSILNWCRDKVALINLNTFLRQNVDYSSKITGAGLGMILKPKDFYGAAILDLINDDMILPFDSSKKKETISRDARRDVLARFRVWKNREKITEKEYEELKKYSLDPILKGNYYNDNKGILFEELEEHLIEFRKKHNKKRKRIQQNSLL